jgi:signal transduction histidine kinase
MTDDLAKTREIDAHFEIVGVEQTLPAETRLLLFRIAQEALNNTKRHTQASRAVVRLEFKRDNLKMTVNDNGKGFELPKRIGDWASIGHLGLAGMQERARLIRGKLAVQSEIGRGTTVAIEVPIKGSLSR